MSAHPIDPADYRYRDAIPIRRALVSVSDKTGLLELATALAAAGVEIVSTGSTAHTIRSAGHQVTDVASVTGFAEALDGRVKTLHPAIHGGILADLRLESHERELAELGIAPFQLVVVNLYPFVETLASGVTGDAAIEQIDIGGPALVRAAAKNHANVAVAVAPARYPEIIERLHLGGTTLAQRQRLAGDAFAHTAAYDTAVAAHFSASVGVRVEHPSAPGVDHPLGASAEHPVGPSVDTALAAPDSPFANTVDLSYELSRVLRYGENSHQAAALYVSSGKGVAQARQLHGKGMSFNNFVDADGAVRAAYDFDAPAVAIIKHAQPCGIAVASTIALAHSRAHDCDPVSAFGAVIAANRTVTLGMAERVADIFTEVVIAPGFEDAALEVLKTKKNIRLLQLPAGYGRGRWEFRQISGGLLMQEPDVFDDFSSAGWTLVSGSEASPSVRADLEFAWRAVRSVKSNAILLASAEASVGVGMGQVNRVDSCRLAVSRAGDRARGSVAASDAFFPFADGLEILLEAGVSAIVQPGGSVRDEEVVAAASDRGATMYFTGERHFYH